MGCFYLLSVCLVIIFYSPISDSTIWPITPAIHNVRPPVDPYCNGAVYPFCPTGYKDSHIPSFADDDVIEIFLLKAPVWEFKFGKLLSEINVIHDAIGFRNTRTGLNYTTEWYELYQLFNCTFPHIVANRSSPVWCNQGAVCFYPGIMDAHWKVNGTLKKIGEIKGAQFANLSIFMKTYNRTLPFYESWRVRSSPDPDGKLWFTPCDCATYVQKMFCQAGKLGAKFYGNYVINYTYITLFCDEPIYLGNASYIFGPQGNKTIADDMMKFYANFQPHQPVLHFLESLLDMYFYIVLEKKFYLFYNDEYWLLPMKSPYVRLSYEEVGYTDC